MSAILFLLTGGYLLWIAAYLFHERNSRRKKAEKAGQILTPDGGGRERDFRQKHIFP